VPLDLVEPVAVHVPEPVPVPDALLVAAAEGELENEEVDVTVATPDTDDVELMVPVFVGTPEEEARGDGVPVLDAVADGTDSTNTPLSLIVV
jgi:hypothetical protein